MRIESLGINGLSKKLNEGYALKSISLRMYRGEIVGILGKNDSGMYALSGVLAGDAAYEEGSISVFEKKIEGISREAMRKAGIYHITSIPKLQVDFTVAESLCTTSPPILKKKWVTHKGMLKTARDILGRYRLNIDAQKRTYQLTPYERSMVEILRAVLQEARILILEDILHPHDQEANKLYYRLLQDLAVDGKTIVTVGTDIGVPAEIADRVVIMRDGKVEGIFYKDSISSVDTEKLLERISRPRPRGRTAVDPEAHVVLKMKNIEVAGYRLDDAYVRTGEVVGFIDSRGNAFHRIAKLLNGEEKYSGEIWAGGRKVRLRSRQDAVKNGIGYLTNYDSRQMAIDQMTVGDNLLLMKYREYARFGWINKRWYNFAVREYLQEHNLPAEIGGLYPRQVGSEIRAWIPRMKWEAVHPKVMVLFNLFAGMDLGMKECAYDFIERMREKGVCFVCCISSGEEMLDFCDRLYVIGRRDAMHTASPGQEID